MVASGRVRRLRGHGQVIGLVASGVVGVGLVVFVVVADATLVAQAHQRSASPTLAFVAAGASAALGTIGAFAWYRTGVGRLGTTTRRVLGRAGIVWGALFVVAFALTHPMNRDDASATPLEVAVVTYCLVIVVAAMCVLPIAIVRIRHPRHQPDDRARVVEIPGKPPYLVAHCDCGWVGPPYDATTPDAPDHAFRDAHEHGTDSASDVEHPLG